MARRQSEYIKYECSHCHKELVRPKDKRKNHFCDEKCKLEFFEKQLKTLKCKYCNKEFKTTTYKFEHNRKYCSRECMIKDNETLKNTYKSLSHYLRTCKEYSEWRLRVLKAANYKCVECNSKENLHAHHIKELYNICKEHNFILEKILHSEIFNDINNGLCLCSECHRKKHPYSDKFINDKGQFCRSEFIRL